MLTLIGSLIGFLSAAFPDILEAYRDKQDRSHELAIMDRQIELQKQGHINRLDEIELQADVEQSRSLYRHDESVKASTWVNNLRASVRPIITYAFFGLFAAVKLATFIFLITKMQLAPTQALVNIWDTETQALFATTMAFWFGNRGFTKRRNES